MKSGVLIGAALAALLATAAPERAAAEADATRIVDDLVYLSVGGVDLRLDLYLHADGAEARAPVLVFLHGGGWSRGRPPDDWTLFEPYVALGFSVVTVEYRLAHQASAPAALQDVRCALAFLAAGAEAFGLDMDRLVVAGASAGAHLALMSGMMTPEPGFDLPGCDAAPRPAAIIDLFGPTDLTATRSANGRLHPAVARWVGDDEGAHERARALSPIAHVSADDPPVIVIHGARDRIVPIGESEKLVALLQAAGTPHRFVVIDEGGHGAFSYVEMARAFVETADFLRVHGIID